MTNIKSKKINLYNIFYVVMLIFGISLLIIFPSLSISSFYQGLQIWATKVLPALLPFFILTKLLSYTNALKSLGNVFTPITSKFYGVGGISGYIYIMSIISGYPVGAKLTSDLYKGGVITSGQAQTITSFASTSGPLFILGTVAIGMYNNSAIGFVIIISHIFGAILNGFLYKNKEKISTCNFSQKESKNILNETMTSSIMSIMIVGGFIAIFYMFLQIILSLNIFSPILNIAKIIGIDEGLSKGMIAGFFEVTTGCLILSKYSISYKLLAILSTFLISFGGLSIHAQAYTFLHDFNMPYKKFFLQKLTHAIFSTVIAIIFSFLFL